MTARRTLKSPARPLAAPTDARSPLQRATIDLLRAVDELHDIHSLIEASQMACRDVEDEPARLPLTMLLQVILDRLAATSENVGRSPMAQVEGSGVDG